MGERDNMVAGTDCSDDALSLETDEEFSYSDSRWATLCRYGFDGVYDTVDYKWLRMAMESLGKHSMNIFLIHTFVYYFWFTDIMYFTKSPFIIFLTLLFTSILLSVLIEKSKQWIGFYRIQQ